ncbi:MAG: hypothetical protein IPF63_11070 [Bacteroidetes bacterium]|nr:hypothetical protein [Bacteroidota bacterium]
MDLKKQYSSDKNPFWADRIGRSGGQYSFLQTAFIIREPKNRKDRF